MKKQTTGRRAAVFFLLLFLLLFGGLVEARAEKIKSHDVFSSTVWDYVTEWSVNGTTDWLQSMCVTDKYIVCYQDSGKTGEPDLLMAFDRWNYQLQFEVRERDYEHGNGMTYNSKTHEIYLAPYYDKLKNDKGAVFVLDADTLKFKYQVQVSDGSWNVASIEYVEEHDEFIVQTTRNYGFTFVRYDSDFNYIDTLFEADKSLGNAFQDFCVSGDLLISIPRISSEYDRTNSRLQIYSISQKQFLGAFSVYAPDAGGEFEIESIAQLDSGEIMLAIALSDKRMALFNTYVPITYTVDTAVENGEITASRDDVDMGSNYTVEYSSTEDFELTGLKVDGQNVSIEENQTSYTFGNIQDDHNLWASFSEIPKFAISTAVTNGKVDVGKVLRRDQSLTIHYEPDLHYEMDRLLIDGEPVFAEAHEEKYTFHSIQKEHTLEVLFREIPSFVVSTKVYRGQITATNKKVYRDENYTVKYEPDKDCRLAYMKVDGKWMTELDTEDTLHHYTFENIQEGHDVVVFYQWKWLSLVILAGAFAFCLPVGLLYFYMEKKRRRRLMRRRQSYENQ